MNKVLFDGSRDEGQKVTDTSKETFKELQESEELTKQEQKVFEACQDMRFAAFTRNELKHEQLPDWEKSTISGRVNGLIEKNRLQKIGKREDMYNGRKAEVLMVVECCKKREIDK